MNIKIRPELLKENLQIISNFNHTNASSVKKLQVSVKTKKWHPLKSSEYATGFKIKVRT